MQILHDFRPTLANPPFTVGHTGLYRIVAQVIASSDDHLTELIRLMVEMQIAGVDLSMHWDCLLEGIILEEMK